MRIAIVGAGWYGCHLALALKKRGYDVVLFDKNADIFQQISGNFGIRLHGGAHYPRSPATRENCLQDFDRFIATYPELVVEHDYAIYGLGKEDALQEPSHVDAKAFDSVCHEFKNTKAIDPKAWGYENLISAYNMPEPSLLVGEPLRDKFRRYLKDADIPVYCHCQVERIEKGANEQIIHSNLGAYTGFDRIINATSYQALLPEMAAPFAMQMNYQTCLGLLYEDLTPQEKPFSTIVMDGLFPCLMPYLNKEEPKKTTYLLTHGLYTLMSANKTVDEAQAVLASIDDDFIKQHVQPHCEKEMNRFWPEFGKRFRYVGWKGTVLAKLRTQSEYRSAITYEKDKTIYIMPGKVSNIFDAEDEVVALLDNKDNILEKEGVRFMAAGALDKGQAEIAQHPLPYTRHTANIQTYYQLAKQRFWQPSKPADLPHEPISAPALPVY